MNEVTKSPAKFDASLLAPASDHAEVEIYNPQTKAGTGMFITVYSKDSETYKGVQRAQQDRRFKHFGRNRGLTVNAAEVENEALELLVACTKSWRDVAYNGETLTCTPDVVHDLYVAVPVIREQVDDAVHDRAGFMKR